VLDGPQDRVCAVGLGLFDLFDHVLDRVAHSPVIRHEPTRAILDATSRTLDTAVLSRYLDIMRNRVREQRTLRGLSQADLAAALEVSRQTVISIENGRYLPSLPLAFRIARLFELPVEKMFEPDDEETNR
jgi:putative transcriptional regulator